jgi:uncharacterized membrane protein
MTLPNIILMLTALAAALMAGLFFAYSNSVTPALGKLADAVYLSAMQSINRTIQNPLFFIVFFGALILFPVSAYLHYGTGRFPFMLAAAIVYIGGVFAVTVLGNIPLNEALDKFDIASATPDTIKAQRIKFEMPWNRLNTIRTISSVLALLLLILSFFGKQKTPMAN